MSLSRLAGCALAALVIAALSGAAAASAEIILWKWLPGAAGEHFSGKTGKTTLQETREEGGLGTAVTCKESKLVERESELTSPATDATLATALITFSGCKAFGVAIESLGDLSGVILARLALHNCIISGTTKGVIIEPEPFHVDVPATGLLIEIGGHFIAEIKAAAPPAVLWTLVISQREARQAISTCEGAIGSFTLTADTDANGPKRAGFEALEPSITFVNAQEAMT
jgi:hypothetical protein